MIKTLSRYPWYNDAKQFLKKCPMSNENDKIIKIEKI